MKPQVKKYLGYVSEVILMVVVFIILIYVGVTILIQESILYERICGFEHACNMLNGSYSVGYVDSQEYSKEIPYCELDGKGYENIEQLFKDYQNTAPKETFCDVMV